MNTFDSVVTLIRMLYKLKVLNGEKHGYYVRTIEMYCDRHKKDYWLEVK